MDHLEALIRAALDALAGEGTLPPDAVTQPQIERARAAEHGDFACNVALTLARQARMKPRDLAALLVERLPDSPWIERVEIAGPGFINFFLAAAAAHEPIRAARREGARYGRAAPRGQRVLVEFVSANPTGPLHVGHGRGAAYGDALVRVLRAAGCEVDAEYYVNDAGRQIDILALSVWLRYLQALGEDVTFPGNVYQGDYIRELAEGLRNTAGDTLRTSADSLLADLPPLDSEAGLDALVRRARELLGGQPWRRVVEQACDALTDDIRDDLEAFGVHYDRWFSERSLFDSGAVQETIGIMRDSGHCYHREGALWFRSTDYGDEKDRVLVRENGAPTYFASDVAYHLDKARRGYDRLINVWGADHHGYIARVQAALQATGHCEDLLRVLLVQFAVLYRSGEKVSMSTRGGQFVTLRELRNEVGNDAARYFYVLRRSDQHLDFDIDLAKSRSTDNPVYYVQYAHARIASVFRQAADKGIAPPGDDVDLAPLSSSHELELAGAIARYPEVVEAAAARCEPHQIAYYLRDVATHFHTWYNAEPFLAAEPPVRAARLALVDATRRVLANGLGLLGVSAPDSM